MRSYGEFAIRELVAVVEHGEITDEKRDCLAMLAGELLVSISVGIKEGKRPLDRELPELVNRLAQYVDKMDDPGAFSHRDYAERGLSIFYENAGLPEFIFNSQSTSIDCMAAITGTTANVAGLTNVSLSKAIVDSASPFPVEKRDAKRFSVVWATLALAGALAISAGVWWGCCRMRK